MKKLMLGTAVVLLASSVAYAQDYQVEIGAAYVDGDARGADFDGIGLSAELHLDKVNTKKGPLNEAAFLDKSSFVNLIWAEFSDTITLGGRYVAPENIIVEASYSDIDGDEKVINLGVVTYLNDNMDAVVSFTNYDEADHSELAVDAHGLRKLDGTRSLAYDLGLSYLDVGSESGIGLRGGADYYLNKAISFGAGLSLERVDDYKESTIDIRANYFVTPIVVVGLAYETVGQDGDGDSIELNAAMRF